MRSSTVKRGLNFLIVAVALITVGSYYHAWVARLLFLSPHAAAQFVSLAFFWGGMFGAVGIVLGPVLAALFMTVWDIFDKTMHDWVESGQPEVSS